MKQLSDQVEREQQKLRVKLTKQRVLALLAHAQEVEIVAELPKMRPDDNTLTSLWGFADEVRLELRLSGLDSLPIKTYAAKPELHERDDERWAFEIDEDLSGYRLSINGSVSDV